MLDDHTSRSFETADGFPSGVRVSDIVIGKFLALMLMETGEQARSHDVFAVEGCLLVRIFAVAHILSLDPLTVEDIGECLGAFLVFVQAREIVGDGAVVASGVRKDLLSQSQTSVGRYFALFIDFGKHTIIVGRIHDHGNRLVILGRGTNHRRTADVDVFDGQFKRAIRPCDRLFERIEIHTDDVNRVDAVIGNRLHVFRHGTTSKNAGVNVWIERLDATVKHFRETRVVGYFLAGHALFSQKLGRAARRQNMVTRSHEPLGKVHDARFVGNTDQCLFAHSFSFNFKVLRPETRA